MLLILWRRHTHTEPPHRAFSEITTYRTAYKFDPSRDFNLDCLYWLYLNLSEASGHSATTAGSIFQSLSGWVISNFIFHFPVQLRLAWQTWPRSEWKHKINFEKYKWRGETSFLFSCCKQSIKPLLHPPTHPWAHPSRNTLFGIFKFLYLWWFYLF